MSRAHTQSPYESAENSWYKPVGHAQTTHARALAHGAAGRTHNYEDYLPVLEYEYKVSSGTKAHRRSQTTTPEAAVPRTTSKHDRRRQNASNPSRPRLHNHPAATRNQENVPPPRYSSAVKGTHQVDNYFKEGDSWYRPRVEKHSVGAKRGNRSKVAHRQGGFMKILYALMRRKVPKDSTSRTQT